MIINFFKKKYSKHKIICFSFLWRALQIFGKQGITFLIFIFCAKLLTPYDFGIYNYILAVVFFLIIFGDFGISTATSKYVAEFNAINKDKLRLIPFNSLLIIVSLGVVVSLLVILFGEIYLKDKYIFVLYVLPMLFLAPISSLYDGIYRGLKRFKELAIISVSVGLFAIGFVYFLVSQYGLIGALISQSLFYLLLVLVLIIRYGLITTKIDKKLMKTIIKYSTVIGFTAIAYYFYTKADIIILGHFNYINEIGYYEIVNKIFEIIKLPTLILATVLAPAITKYYAEKKYHIVKKKFLKHLYYSSAFGVILGILLYIIIPPLIELFFNEYFIPETILIFKLLLLILPTRIVATIISQSHAIATGNAHFSLWTMIPAGILNIVLDFVFIYYFGFIGVVYSTLICFTFAISSFIILYYIKLNKLSKCLN